MRTDWQICNNNQTNGCVFFYVPLKFANESMSDTGNRRPHTNTNATQPTRIQNPSSILVHETLEVVLFGAVFHFRIIYWQKEVKVKWVRTSFSGEHKFQFRYFSDAKLFKCAVRSDIPPNLRRCIEFMIAIKINFSKTKISGLVEMPMSPMRLLLLGGWAAEIRIYFTESS